MHRFFSAVRSHVAEMEDLEAREMMSATPTSWKLEAPATLAKAVTIATASTSKTTVVTIPLTEPAIGDASLHYASFATDPLFSSAGPTADDVRQGELGDCYLMASLSAIAKSQPGVIRNDIQTESNGTYRVAFESGKTAAIETVDPLLPVNSTGQLAYAQLGSGNSLWVAVMEKAFAEFRDGSNSYWTVAGGWMGEVFSDLGLTNKSTIPTKSTATLLSQLQADLKANEATTIGTATSIDEGAPLLDDHAYVVDRVNLGANGKPVSVRLRNPWGVDGAGNDGDDDGYVTVNVSQMAGNFVGVCAAVMK